MKSNRDLLVLARKGISNQKEIELEVEKLHQLLLHAESMENFCTVNEVIDINRYRIIQNRQKIEKIIRQDKLKPFVFVSNKN